MRMMFHAIVFAVLAMGPAAADVKVTFALAYLDAAGAGAARALPNPDVTVSNVYTGASIPVLAPSESPVGEAQRIITLGDGDFSGPYARVRVALSGLTLPPEDAKAATPLSFAFEMIIARDIATQDLRIEVPVIVSSRKSAMKPFMSAPRLAEELPQSFMVAQQYLSAYQASPEDVAQSPASFALHRLIVRAVADYSILLTKLRKTGVQIVPAEELASDIKLYWTRDGEARRGHLKAYIDSRTVHWLDAPQIETLLRRARKAGAEGVALCNAAREMVDFFDQNRPIEAEARKVDSMFPNPGTLQGYLDGRRTDIGYVCERPKV